MQKNDIERLFIMERNIPFFAVNEPYELYYKKELTAYPVSAHTHNVAEIYLTLTELPDVLLNDTVSSVHRGSLIIIPPFCIHQLYHKPAVVYERYILNINTEWITDVLRGNNTNIDYLMIADRPVIISLNDRQLEDLTDRLNLFLSVQSNNNMNTITCFFDLFCMMNSIVSSKIENNLIEEPVISKAQKKVNDIIAYIKQNSTTEISVEQIAGHFYLNKDYISRLFSKYTHTSLGRYVALQRIIKAQELLRHGKTVSEVQELMGYSSYAHFFKTFQKLTGISPSQYRKCFFLSD